MNKPILLFLLIFTSIIYAQTDKLKISGTVIDEKGMPIPNVTITFDEKAVSTDIEGKYTIDVKSSKSSVKFSFIGFEPQIVVVGKNKTIDITLKESTNALDEVVVIGYGTQKRSHVTGAVSKFKDEKLDEIAVSRLDQALQGKIAGVQIQNTSSEAGSDTQITIRGVSSVNAGASPLIVIDGQPVPDGLSSLNMADVESVDVLKDAASAAIYGSRGASGVILITTKSGKSDKVKYSLKYSSGFKQAYSKYPVMSSTEYVERLFAERDLKLTDPSVNQANNTITANNRATYVVEQDMLGGKGIDYQDEVLQTGEFRNIQLSATGGTSKVRYFLSGGYTGDEGVMIKSNFEKYNFRSKLDIDLSKKVKLSVNLNPSFQTKESPSENFTNFIRYPSFLPIYHNETTAAFVRQNSLWSGVKAGDYAHPRHFNNLTYSGIMPDGTMWAPTVASPFNSAQNNPMGSLLSQEITTDEYRFQGSANLVFNILPGLDFKTMGSVYMNYAKRQEWADRDATGDGVVNKAVYINNTYIDLLSENTLNYKKSFGQHSLDALAGFTVQKTQKSNIQTTGLSFPSDKIHTLNNALQFDKNGTFSYETPIGLLSYLGRINYSYAGKYLLSASFRADGSSYFGAGNKWGYFPAASVGWVVSKEEFLSKADWLSKLTFRASYGVSGNNRIVEFGYVDLLTSANYSLGEGSGSAVSGQTPTTGILANPDITWETTNQANFGMDLSILKNRFNLSVDVYQSKTNELLLQQANMAFTGVPLYWNNIGSLNNKGIEFELSTTNIKTKDFKWTTSANLSHTENKVRELGDEAYLRNQGERTEVYQNKVGDPLVQFYGFKTDGVWLSQSQIDQAKAGGLTSSLPNLFIPGGLKLVDTNGDNVLDNDDRTVTGNPYPDFTWGITNVFTYKAVDFSFTFQGVQGGELVNGDPNYNETKQRNTNYNTNRWLSEMYPGDGKTPYELNGFNWMLTDYVVEDASYFALREVSLGYNFPEYMAKQIGLSSLRLYASGQNMYFNSAKGYRGINPEGRSNNGPYASSLISGYQRGAFPIPKTVIIGIDLNF
ncbi:SusC/RagA family TonB-linked outer membrane protein [Flavobacterium sp. WC2509]|uniref:SusC/RagA family TonB-linked outer membrane protein n=1 Tax=Flavobacterium sp. WC2509 TaxID=3461406 RepID=UPI004044496D